MDDVGTLLAKIQADDSAFVALGGMTEHLAVLLGKPDADSTAIKLRVGVMLLESATVCIDILCGSAIGRADDEDIAPLLDLVALSKKLRAAIDDAREPAREIYAGMIDGAGSARVSATAESITSRLIAAMDLARQAGAERVRSAL